MTEITWGNYLAGTIPKPFKAPIYFGNGDCAKYIKQEDLWKQTAYGKRIIIRDILYGSFDHQRRSIDNILNMVKKQLDIFVKEGELTYTINKNIITVSFCFHVYIEVFLCGDQLYLLISQPPLSPFRKNVEINLLQKAIFDALSTDLHKSLYDVIPDPPPLRRESIDETDVWDSFPEAIRK